jgi:hypothetical protein
MFKSFIFLLSIYLTYVFITWYNININIQNIEKITNGIEIDE